MGIELMVFRLALWRSKLLSCWDPAPKPPTEFNFVSILLPKTFPLTVRQQRLKARDGCLRQILASWFFYPEEYVQGRDSTGFHERKENKHIKGKEAFREYLTRIPYTASSRVSFEQTMKLYNGIEVSSLCVFLQSLIFVLFIFGF